MKILNNTGIMVYEDRDTNFIDKVMGAEYIPPLTTNAYSKGLWDFIDKFMGFYLINPRDVSSGLNVTGGVIEDIYKIKFDEDDLQGYLSDKLKTDEFSGITLDVDGVSNKVIKVSLNINESGSTSEISLLKDIKTLKKLVADSGILIEQTADEISFSLDSSFLTSENVTLTDNSIESLSGIAINQAEANEEFVEEIDSINEKLNLTSQLTKESTGFSNPEGVIVNFDETTYTITLTGDVSAYYQNETITELVSGWNSTIPVELRASTSSLFLYYNGTDFIWSLTPWKFYDLQIAVVTIDSLGNYIGAMKETHGFMDWESHRRFHEVIGTTLASGNEVSNVVLDSTVVNERRPIIAESVLGDEDLYTTLPALNDSNYSIGYIDGTHFVVNKDENDIVPLSGNIPFYNKNTGGTFSQELLMDGQYINVWLYCSPASSDTFSQKARYVFVQGQNVFNTLESALGNNIQDLFLNGVDSFFPELVFTKRFVVRYKDLNWIIVDYEDIEGSRNTQISNITRTNKTGGLIVNKPSTESYSGMAETQNIVNEEFNSVINILVNTVNSLAGASSTLEATVPKVITTTPSVVAYTTLIQSTNEDIFVLNDTTESILVKKAGIYQWLYELDIDNSNPQPRTLTLATRNKVTSAIISSSNISVSKDGLQGSFTTQITIPSDDTVIEVIAYGSNNGLTILYAGANFILNRTDVPLYNYSTNEVNGVSDSESITGDITSKTQYDLNIENSVAILQNEADISTLESSVYNNKQTTLIYEGINGIVSNTGKFNIETGVTGDFTLTISRNNIYLQNHGMFDNIVEGAIIDIFNKYTNTYFLSGEVESITYDTDFFYFEMINTLGFNTTTVFGESVIEFSNVAGSGGDGKVLVDDIDTTAKYLEDKIIGGTNITIVKGYNIGGEARLTVNCDLEPLVADEIDTSVLVKQPNSLVETTTTDEFTTYLNIGGTVTESDATRITMTGNGVVNNPTLGETIKVLVNYSFNIRAYKDEATYGESFPCYIFFGDGASQECHNEFYGWKVADPNTLGDTKWNTISGSTVVDLVGNGESYYFQVRSSLTTGATFQMRDATVSITELKNSISGGGSDLSKDIQFYYNALTAVGSYANSPSWGDGSGQNRLTKSVDGNTDSTTGTPLIDVNSFRYGNCNPINIINENTYITKVSFKGCGAFVYGTSVGVTYEWNNEAEMLAETGMTYGYLGLRKDLQEIWFYDEYGTGWIYKEDADYNTLAELRPVYRVELWELGSPTLSGGTLIETVEIRVEQNYMSEVLNNNSGGYAFGTCNMCNISLTKGKSYGLSIAPAVAYNENVRYISQMDKIMISVEYTTVVG